MSKLRRAMILIGKTRGVDSGQSACLNFDCCERCLMTRLEASGGITFPGRLLEADDATSITIAQTGLLVIFHVTAATRMFAILTRLHVLDWCMIIWRSHCLPPLMGRLSPIMVNASAYTYRSIHYQYTLPQYPSLSASRAKFDPTVLLALLPTHFPTSGPSTLYFVPKGTLCSPLVKYAWVVLTIAS